jgi:hypothetical protein
MKPKRQIRGKEFVEDLRAGLTTAELMEKYQLNSEGLRKIFRILVDASAMRKTDIEALNGLYEAPEDEKGIRRAKRKLIEFPLYVYDGIDQLVGGKVLDVSEKGFRVKGIKTYVGDQRTFIVRFGTQYQGKPFVFDAVCRWMDVKTKDPRQWISGFEITGISHLDSMELEHLLLQ